MTGRRFGCPARPALALVLAVAAAAPACALDLSWSGFGTVGWVASNREWVYDRGIDRGGSFERDSLLGLQADARLSPEWSATLQLKAAPAQDRDNAWELTPTWAFVAWRPGDDWLLRAGRLRVPLYLYSEQLDVGATHDFARLPAEMYSISPTVDVDGAALARAWNFGDDEITLDAYAGRRDLTERFWSRDGGAGGWEPGPNFVDAKLRGAGLALTLRQPRGVWRVSVHRIRTSLGSAGIAVRPVAAQWMGHDFYKTSNALPFGPEVETLGTITNYVATVGAERSFGKDWRIAAEYARNVQRDTELGADTAGGYVAVFRRFGALTAHASAARLRSSRRNLDWYRRLTTTQVPDGVPMADLLNAAQRVQAETIHCADQRSFALGASWAIAGGRKLKLEWQRTGIGRMSRLAETPPGAETIHDTHVDLWSIHYDFSFF